LKSFPAKQRAMTALLCVVSAAIVFYCVGFPMPLALLIASILWLTATKVVLL
jgi:hypothetical protein